ncbi:MAG: hypothetical protein IKL89_00425 [Clostridia bacterium]|nr:hypothetical protein [Clostridia bacterium]
MKNEFFYENIDRLYAAAKEKHGERAEEALVAAVRKTAGKFKKLGEKAYITLLLQELGVGAFYQAEESAPYELAEKLEAAFEEGLLAAKKRGRKYALLGCAAAVVCVAVAIGFALQPDHTPAGVITIDGAKELTSGDFVLSNVHTINDYTGFDGEFGRNLKNESKYAVSSTVAPDGTVYLLAVSDTAGEMDTLGLYQMTTKGWDLLHTFEPRFVTSYSIRNFVFCDAESRPVAFLYDKWNETLTAYTYDPKSGKVEETAAISVQIDTNMTDVSANIVAVADEENVYFACSNGSTRVDFVIFDFKSREFRQSEATVKGSSIHLNAIARRGDRTYLLVVDASSGGGNNLNLYCYKNIGKDSQELIFEKQLYAGAWNSLPRLTDGGSILVDSEGKVYAFYTFVKNPRASDRSAQYALEIVSPEGESLTSKTYKCLQYPSFPFVTGSRGIFMGSDGTLYFIEDYNQASVGQICIGMITGEDYGKIKEVASFRVENSMLLQPQYISDPTGAEGLFVDLLGVYWGSASMQHGYMRLRLK